MNAEPLRVDTTCKVVFDPMLKNPDVHMGND